LSNFLNIKIRNPRSPLHARTIAIPIEKRRSKEAKGRAAERREAVERGTSNGISWSTLEECKAVGRREAIEGGTGSEIGWSMVEEGSGVCRGNKIESTACCASSSSKSVQRCGESSEDNSMDRQTTTTCFDYSRANRGTVDQAAACGIHFVKLQHQEEHREWEHGTASWIFFPEPTIHRPVCILCLFFSAIA
jgi:hypothetical protein